MKYYYQNVPVESSVSVSLACSWKCPGKWRCH